MTKLEQIEKIEKSGCNGVCADCILTNLCGKEPRDLARGLLVLMSYDSDLSKSKVGDWVWSVEDRWVQIKEIEYGRAFPIILKEEKRYTFDGKHYCTDCAPVVFSIPPLCFNPEPKPELICKFKKGDKVLVSNRSDDEKNYRYFAYISSNLLFPYFCFVNGGDEWSSKGRIGRWKYCEAYKETSSTNIIPISEGTVLPDGGIVACKHNGYWLVVAPATQRGTSIKWGLYGTDTSLINITDATVPNPQDGKLNTDVLTSPTYSTIIDKKDTLGCPAAEFCRALSADYFLPNKEELLAIQAVAADIDAADTSGAGMFSAMGTDWIWTSTNYNSTASWIVRASDGSVFGSGRGNAYRVVPVRRIAI